MNKRSTRQQGAPKLPADLSPEQMRQGILKIQRRIDELKALNIQKLKSGTDPDLIALQTSIESTLESVFGSASTDFDRYKGATKLDLTLYTLSLNPFGDYQGTSVSEIQNGISGGRDRAVALLEQAVRSLKEALEDQGETRTGRALRAYEGLDLHAEIERAADELYRGGHYANAIEDAVKALNDLVRLRSGQTTDGTSLMESVFSPNKPILKFNDLTDQSERDEQKGFMMMFSGAVAGLRNPRAHKLIKDDPERALEFIAFVSLLAKLLDGAKK
jgi:uncharacterized protein (TIGR02391 family)